MSFKDVVVMKTNSTLKRSVKKHVLIMIMNMMKNPMKLWIINQKREEDPKNPNPKDPKKPMVRMKKRRAMIRTVQNCQEARKKNVKKIIMERMRNVPKCQGARKKIAKKRIRVMKMAKVIAQVKASAKRNKKQRTANFFIHAKKVMQNHHVIQNVHQKANVMLPKGQGSSRLCVLMTKKRK